MEDLALNEIANLLSLITSNLSLSLKIQDLNSLLSPDLYFLLYERMFPFLKINIQEFKDVNSSDGEKIQNLIDLLSADILTMDLSHIKGEVDGIRTTPISRNSSQISKHSSKKTRSLPNFNEDVQIYEKPNDDDDNENPNNDDLEANENPYEEANKPISEVSKSKESSAYDYKKKFEKKQIAGKAANKNKIELEPGQKPGFIGEGIEFIENEDDVIDYNNVINDKNPSDSDENNQYYGKWEDPNDSKNNFEETQKNNIRAEMKNEKKEEINASKTLGKNSKKIQEKKIEKNLFPTMQKKYLTAKPKNSNKKDDKKISKEEDRTYAENVNTSNFPVSESSKKMDNTDVQLNNKKFYDIIPDNYKKMKEGIPMKKDINIPEEEPETQELLVRQRNKYKAGLKDTLKQHQISQLKQDNTGDVREKNFLKKLKKLRTDNVNFQKEFENEQKSQFYKLRDEKVNYLRKIHRIIFELEKRKIIDDKKQYKESRKLRNEETRYVLESIENAYKDKITILREKLIEQRKERHLAELAQKEVVSKLENELKAEKKRQMDELKEMWKCEKEKFDLLVKDDGLLEQKIMELYKKY